MAGKGKRQVAYDTLQSLNRINENTKCPMCGNKIKEASCQHTVEEARTFAREEYLRAIAKWNNRSKSKNAYGRKKKR